MRPEKRKNRLALVCVFALAAVGVVVAGAALVGMSSCGGGDCQVEGENCSSSYKKANGIDYGCCSGLSCRENALGDLVCR